MTSTALQDFTPQGLANIGWAFATLAMPGVPDSTGGHGKTHGIDAGKTLEGRFFGAAK